MEEEEEGGGRTVKKEGETVEHEGGEMGEEQE